MTPKACAMAEFITAKHLQILESPIVAFFECKQYVNPAMVSATGSSM